MVSIDSSILAPAVSHQRKIRDAMMAKYPRPVMTSLDGCYVDRANDIEERIGGGGHEEYFSCPDPFARDLILTYEWLKTLPKISEFSGTFGLYDPSYSKREPIGVVMFGYGSGNRARLVCGEEYTDKAICLERGACVHWAPKNAASFLISQACSQMRDLCGWKIFYAYADPEAGEIGTVYQACNWLYIGQGVGSAIYKKEYLPPVNNPCRAVHRWTSEREERGYRNGYCGHSITKHKEMGWEERKVPAKHRYVHFEGNRREQRKLREALQYPVLPYPKRELPALSG